MCAMYLGFLAALVTVTYSAVAPAGSCGMRHITPISLDPKSLLRTCDFIYLTDDGHTTDSIDHITCVITQNDDHTMKTVTITVLKDNSSSSQEYNLTVFDNVIEENAIDDGLPVDLRYIVIPKGKTLSKKSLRYLLNVDKKNHFKGKLIRLPNQLN